MEREAFAQNLTSVPQSWHVVAPSQKAPVVARVQYQIVH